MRAEIILDWNYDHPLLDGMYFVAVFYGEGAGMLEFMEFKNGEWLNPNGGSIFAHIDIGKLNQQLHIRWPDGPDAHTTPFRDEFREV